MITSSVKIRYMPSGRSETAPLPLSLRPFRRVLNTLTSGHLRLALPDGGQMFIDGHKPGPIADLNVMRWRVFRRAAMRGDVGLGEAFMDGDWTSPDLPRTLEYFAVNTARSGHVYLPRGIDRVRLSLSHALRRNSRSMARRNIAAHYDLGNDFYAMWLDRTMSYSSALFASASDDLEAAQLAKYDALIQELSIKENDRVLEIGCGWGGFACRIAEKTGARVTAITLSAAQLAYAQDLVQRRGLTERVAVILQDYRDIEGVFDKVVSVEMIEAVGEQFWALYFEKVARALAPGGAFGLQAITIRDSEFQEYRQSSDFIQTYIFPGGMLLPQNGMHEIAARAGLHTRSERMFGHDYARTLSIWRHQFLKAWPQIAEQGFDLQFQRMWEFYLAISEAGFRSELINVSQTLFHRTGDDASR